MADNAREGQGAIILMHSLLRRVGNVEHTLDQHGKHLEEIRTEMATTKAVKRAVRTWAIAVLGVATPIITVVISHLWR